MTARVKESEVNREEVLNVVLAQMLTARGVPARPERRSRPGAPDARVTLRSGLILLECKWQGGQRELDAQLRQRRSAFPEAIAALGVLYPSRLRHAQDAAAALAAARDLQWWQARMPTLFDLDPDTPPALPRLSRGSVADLADHLRALPLELQGVDQVQAAAGSIAYALDQAAYRLDRHRRIAGRVAHLIAETDQEKDRAAALRIGCLALFNALAFQDRLAVVNDDVETVREASRQGIPSLRNAWRFICENIDYVPVFKLAADILDVLLDGPDEVQAPVIAPLVKAVGETRNVEGHDLSGRLFHTLLSDAKFTGAYYTSVPAATLLTRLVFHEWPAGVDWRDHEFPASLSVADLACGTGTLLMAVAAEAERRHKAAGGNRAAALHKAMVEQALHGYDVQLSAIHFAATSLAMLNPHIEFDRMNLHVMPLGVEGERVNLGSLDYLGTDEALVQHALSPDESGARQDVGPVSGGGPGETAERQTAKLPRLDLAIMNPPFTRSVGGNLLFGSKPGSERRRLQDELSRRLKQRQASATAGLGAAFVAAVSDKMLPNEGRLALVLPLTVCTGPSWAQTRALIERDFTLDVVITSHDPQRWNFSDSTDLSEALLIATRRSRAPNRHPPSIRHSGASRNPETAGDSRQDAAQPPPQTGSCSSDRHSRAPLRHSRESGNPSSSSSSPHALDSGLRRSDESRASEKPEAELQPSEQQDAAQPRTTFVNLWQNPDGPTVAHRIAQAVSVTEPSKLEASGAALLEVDDQHVGEVVSISESDLSGKQWFGVQFARADVTRSAFRLLDHGEVWVPGAESSGSIPLCRLGELGEIGPDRRRLVDGFDRTSSITAYPMVEGHDTEQRKTLACSPDAYLSPLVKPRGGQRPGYGEHLWQQSGRLLISERLRLDTARIVAMRSEKNVLSNVWWPVQIEEIAIERALVVWLNSSLGLLTVLAQRTSTEGGWVAMKKADLQDLPVLDPRCLSASQLQELSCLFDRLSTAEFERLPNMAHCPARRALDDGISQILNLPDLSTLRHLLASEPVISNRRL
ncbi:MAG: hypothetical protein OXK81_02825 [Chloroflexota bacterium]|nr:hypothetical protein [Chloroflexota bacterium]MDE2931635.1 hypothetical protein [Chloroflexota bacterium]